MEKYKRLHFIVQKGDGEAVAKEKEKKVGEKKASKETAESVVLVGVKPVMNYVVACLTIFNAGEKEVVVKARGRAISRAVDAVELLRRSFVQGLEIKKIETGTEEIVRFEGQRANVSTMEIVLRKT